jgi:hypothetical protein
MIVSNSLIGAVAVVQNSSTDVNVVSMCKAVTGKYFIHRKHLKHQLEVIHTCISKSRNLRRERDIIRKYIK